ncbi:esterase/lipase family protein [Cupriavidus taiwanensis]|nr:GPI inositol-deacylase [Cupriavidus taiwanensis]
MTKKAEEAMQNERNPSDPEVVISRTRDIDGRPVFDTHLTPTEDTRTKVIETKLPAVIPIVFLPGIMGTNLKNKKTGNAVWRPPNMSLNLADILGVVAALATWGIRGPKQRQQILKAEDLTVDDGGSIDVGESGLAKETARKRGWGSVLRTSYNPVMGLLEARTSRIVANRTLQGWWSTEGLRPPGDYGEETGQPPLTEPELMKAARYDFDVWCAGYNWLQSNRKSAEDVRQYIENTVLRHYREQKPPVPADKVILVTHSMGGLVARALTNLVGYEKVLGVVHGVLPATGAPAIYHHMRAGYEGPEQLILGSNAGEVTAVVANSAGALELCPTFDHRSGQPWLLLQDSNGLTNTDEEGMPCHYPRIGNPYDEIYKNPSWYGLVPAQNTKFLDLSETEGGTKKNTRARFNFLIDEVETFHRDISSQYHDESFVHYGADGSKSMHSWQDIVWRGSTMPFPISQFPANDNGNGSFRLGEFRDGPKLTRVSGSGDGTVPTSSGEAPHGSGVKASFRQGPMGHGACNIEDKGYDHQSSYNDPRARWATLYGVIRIAQLANWAP